jgi:hypothetical protein
LDSTAASQERRDLLVPIEGVSSASSQKTSKKRKYSIFLFSLPLLSYCIQFLIYTYGFVLLTA